MPLEDAAPIPVNYLTAYHSMFTMGKSAAGRPHSDSRRGGRRWNCRRATGTRARAGDFWHGWSREAGILRKIRRRPRDRLRKDDFVDAVRKFAPDGIEMVMDAIGGKSFCSYKCLGPTGRLVVYGSLRRRGTERKARSGRGPSALFCRRPAFIR